MKCQRCGKENPAEVHTCTPLAFRLADWLDGHSNGPMDAKHKAAAELRRLYADLENAQRHFAETMQAYQDEIKANKALLEALTFIAEHDLTGTDLTVAGHIAHGLIGKARAALQQRLGEKE